MCSNDYSGCSACGAPLVSKRAKTCSPKCRKALSRKKSTGLKISFLRSKTFEYLIKQCRRAGTVQILEGFKPEDFITLRELLALRDKAQPSSSDAEKARYPWNICHRASVKSGGTIHPDNLFVGDERRNKSHKEHLSVGRRISGEIAPRWQVSDSTPRDEVQKKIIRYLKHLEIYDACCKMTGFKSSSTAKKQATLEDLDANLSFNNTELLTTKQLNGLLQAKGVEVGSSFYRNPGLPEIVVYAKEIQRCYPAEQGLMTFGMDIVRLLESIQATETDDLFFSLHDLFPADSRPAPKFIPTGYIESSYKNPMAASSYCKLFCDLAFQLLQTGTYERGQLNELLEDWSEYQSEFMTSPF